MGPLQLVAMVALALPCLTASVPATAAGSPPPQHSHAAGAAPGKERELDGAYSPRDHSHYHGDEHHTEFDHEAILGSTKEAEEFDHLPPEEAKKRLRILLGKMDLNHDQQIDRNELHAWILRSFHMLSQEESKEKLEEADTNEDGKVTWEEYVAETFGDDSDEDNEIGDSEEEKKLMENDKALFTAADANKDGTLDKDEFRSFSHPEESPDMLPVILKQTLEDKDANGDGFIDFKEYVGERGLEEHEASKYDRNFFERVLDKDGDGKLDQAELIAWTKFKTESDDKIHLSVLALLSQDGTPVPAQKGNQRLISSTLQSLIQHDVEIAEDEVDHLFASADDNHDDYLGFNEILDHHDVFVGSEATDFGDHLHNIHVFQDEL